MFQYWRDLARKHKRKIIVSTGVVAASYLIGKYVASKIEQFQKRVKEENFAKEQVKRRFKQTQNDSYMTFLSLLPVLVEPIYEELNVEEITRELRSRRPSRKNAQTEDNTKSEAGLSTVASEEFNTPITITPKDEQILQSTIQNKSKSELWGALKIVSLTRFLTLFYSQSILIIYLHLQLNILSRKSYYESAVKLASIRDADLETPDSLSEDEGNTLPEQAFLSFSWWFLNKGWLRLKDIIEDSVEDVFGEIDPRQKLTIKEFASLINTCQQAIYKKLRNDENAESLDSNQSVIVSSLLPPHDKEFYLLQQTNSADFLAEFNSDIANTENLEKLLTELKEYLANEQVISLLNLLVTVGISLVLDNILATVETSSVSKADTEANEPSIAEISPEKLKLASLLALITKQSNKLTNSSLDNEILGTLNNLQELEDFSASIYSNFKF